MMINFDVAIIGAGPAGLFAAHYILMHSTHATIVLIEKGKAVQERKCCGNCHICNEKDRCSILCGVGGSGLFSDGKLVLDLHSGGKLDAITNLSEEKRESLKTTIVKTLKDYDGKSESSSDISDSEQKRWKKLCNAAGLEIKHYDVLHMGTENLHHITLGFAKEICENPRVSLKLNCEIVSVEGGINDKSVLRSSNGESFSAKNVIFSVGKTGSSWMKSLFTGNGIVFRKENTYVGVRLEVPHEALERLFEYSFDPKIWAYYGDRKVKTHCFCRHGDIVCSNYMGFPIVGGHTRFTVNNEVPVDCQSSKGNFNILVSTNRADGDVRDMLEKFLRVNPDGILVQRLSDFLSSEKADAVDTTTIIAGSKAGNIRELLDGFDETGAIISDFIFRLSNIVPGILGESSMVYAPALEWFMDSVEVDNSMETAHKGWFAVGDGAGLSQGIVHSAATSIIAAEEICRRMIE